MRRKKLASNTLASLSSTIISIICGFILPHQILACYGSEVNGVVSSIKQFLAIIGFLDLGVGAVVRSSLYKPLAENDNVKISQIMKSSTKFFRTIGLIILVYVLILIPVYPVISGEHFAWTYTAVLILAMSVDSLAQHYFGMSNRILLSADQKGYIQFLLQSVTMIINTITCVILMNHGVSIQGVKLTTSFIYLIRPVVIYWYVQKKYIINYKVHYDEEPIVQKWYGVAQHIAKVVLDGTDIVVLTMFSTLQNVSIYSVYQLVLNGVKELYSALLSGGVSPLLGELWAKQEIEKLNKFFQQLEWLVHTSCLFIFGNTAVLIVPFVKIYTDGVSDTNYYMPFFAVTITIAVALYCLRIPYNIMILAGGHYKQTQKSYILATFINILISVISVKTCGLVGVAIGTVIAMLYQIIWQALYISHNLVRWPFERFCKQMIVDMFIFAVGFLCTYRFELGNISYLSWVILALKTVSIWALIIMLINLVFYRDEIVRAFFQIKRKRHNSF